MPENLIGQYGIYGKYVSDFHEDSIEFLGKMDYMHKKYRFDNSSTPIASIQKR